ncbi:unnamed protein product [Linum trigynum]|uniref:Uncharacterized protein n=1 Tax=Linum trigynum TaxID=586398 RepID=A0AAV2FBN4_9ROSI
MSGVITTAESSRENPRTSSAGKNDLTVPETHQQSRASPPLVTQNEDGEPREWGGTLRNELKLTSAAKSLLPPVGCRGSDQFHSEAAGMKTPKLKSSIVAGSFLKAGFGGKGHGTGSARLETNREARLIPNDNWGDDKARGDYEVGWMLLKRKNRILVLKNTVVVLQDFEFGMPFFIRFGANFASSKLPIGLMKMRG